MDFTKEGMPIMLLTVAVATVYCIVRYAPALFA